MVSPPTVGESAPQMLAISVLSTTPAVNVPATQMLVVGGFIPSTNMVPPPAVVSTLSINNVLSPAVCVSAMEALPPSTNKVLLPAVNVQMSAVSRSIPSINTIPPLTVNAPTIQTPAVGDSTPSIINTSSFVVNAPTMETPAVGTSLLFNKEVPSPVVNIPTVQALPPSTKVTFPTVNVPTMQSPAVSTPSTNKVPSPAVHVSALQTLPGGVSVPSKEISPSISEKMSRRQPCQPSRYNLIADSIGADSSAPRKCSSANGVEPTTFKNVYL